jgi:glycerol-3-phosphate dehydrogenase
MNMIEIKREPEQQARAKYDLIIIGGGIYGLMLLLEAIRRKLKPLLIEKHDFGSQTSLNHLRTIHGGLRYLQTLDIKRFRESISERKWFLQHHPKFVKVMPCLMPLYQKGLKRVGILRIAALINDLLSVNRNRQVPEENRLPGTRIIHPGEVRDIFPGVDASGLKGGVVWHDGSIEEYQRLFMEILKLTVNNGATVLNYFEAKELISSGQQVRGLRARDAQSGENFEFIAPIIINATGPWSRELTKKFDRDYPELFPKRLLNWNVLFDREALSRYSLGLTSSIGKEHTYFFHNWKNRLLVGTGELVVEASDSECRVPPIAMDQFLRDINSTVPELAINSGDILRVFSGILPARENGRLAVKESFINHSTFGGPQGLFSISGVKYTTARLVAEKTLNKIFPGQKRIEDREMAAYRVSEDAFFDYKQLPDENDLKALKLIQSNEAVIHLSDLILRRTSLGDNPGRIDSMLEKLRSLFHWDDRRWHQETTRLRNEMNLTGINPVDYNAI